MFTNRCLIIQVRIILEKKNKNKFKTYEAREIKIMEAQRFQLLSDEDLERLCDKSHNKNTVRTK